VLTWPRALVLWQQAKGSGRVIFESICFSVLGPHLAATSSGCFQLPGCCNFAGQCTCYSLCTTTPQELPVTAHCALQPVVTLQGFGTTLTVAYHTVEPRYGNLFASMRMLVTSGDLRLSVSGGRAATPKHCCHTGCAPLQLHRQLVTCQSLLHTCAFFTAFRQLRRLMLLHLAWLTATASLLLLVQ
jgi:hypothetical protein